jgi:iron complex outermembrane recepter protein
MDWSDIQINVITQGFSTTGNAAKAKSDGAEVSLDIVPIDSLSLRLSTTYNDAKIASNAPSLGAVDGNPLPYSPKLSVSGAFDYRPTVAGRFTPNAGLTFAYYSKQNTGFQNGTTYKLRPYGTLDLRGGIEWSQYSLLARVDNVTDRYALTDVRSSTALGAPLVGTVLKPRTYGLSFEARF